MRGSHDLTQRSVGYQLIRLASPLTLAIIALLSVAIVDTYYLGQLGVTPLAAIGFAFPVGFAVTSLAIGLGAGAGSVLSRAIGRGNSRTIRRCATDSLLLAALVGTLVALIGLVTIEPLFALLGATGDVMDDVQSYMRVWYFSFPALVIAQVAASLLRANGDAFTPSLLMILTAAINIILDPILIFGGYSFPAMGMEGAAWAAFFARLPMPIAAIAILVWRDGMLAVSRHPVGEAIASWSEILRIGLPAALGNAINPIGITIVTGLLASYGDQTVAAFGLANRLEAFAVIPMLALSGSIGPVAGQNWGAGRFDRVDRALTFSFAVCLVWSLIIALVFLLSAGTLVDQFSTSKPVCDEARIYLWIVPVTLAGYGFTIISAGAFNALGRPIMALALYLLRTAVLYVPLAGAAMLFFSSIGVFASIALSNLLAGIFVFILARQWLTGMVDRRAVPV